MAVEPAPVVVVKTERHLLQETLYSEWQKTWSDLAHVPVSDENKSKKIKIKVREVELHGNHLQFILEKEDIGVVPEQFIDLMKSMERFGKMSSAHRDKLDMLKIE